MKRLRLAGTVASVGALAFALTAAGTASAAPAVATLADTTTPNCTVVVPSDLLSSAGLATPYQLSGTPTGQSCDDVNPNESAFVQGVLDSPGTGQISVYSPLSL